MASVSQSINRSNFLRTKKDTAPPRRRGLTRHTPLLSFVPGVNIKKHLVKGSGDRGSGLAEKGGRFR